jgi:hypothetical protein
VAGHDAPVVIRFTRIALRGTPLRGHTAGIRQGNATGEAARPMKVARWRLR